MNKRLLVVSLCLALLTSFALPFTHRAYAAPTTIFIDPPSIINEAITPGNNVTFMVNVADITNLFAYEFKIFYKLSVLNATQAVRPAGQFLEPLDPMNQFAPKWEIKNNFNATHGRLWLGFTLLAPETARTGNGTLVQLTFKVVGIDSTFLTFADTKLADDTSSPISHIAEGSYFSNAPPPPPPPNALIYVNPDSIIDPALTPSNSFSVDVNIINGSDVFVFSFKLSFDPAIIEATGIAEGPYLSSAGPTTILTSQIDNTTGFVVFSVTLNAPPGANGDGTLATVTFHVLAMGATNLTLSETSLVNSASEPQPHVTSNGYFANVILAKIFVDPPEIIDPMIRPGDTFYLNISMENVQNLYAYRFHLGYNTEVLTCIGVMINLVQNETRFTNMFSVDDSIGDVFVNVTYLPPANPISTVEPLAFVTLLFKVDAMGISNLVLSDTSLVDDTGAPISHETQDGYFQSVTRDVAVIEIVPYKSWVYEGRKVNVSVTVQNQGDFFAETFDVTLFADANTIGTMTVHDLPTGQNTTLTFVWNTVGLPPAHVYALNAAATSVPFEVDLVDNSLIMGTVKIRIMGDVNGDDSVDLFDLVAVAVAFGSTPSDPNWNPEADLQEDGIIDIFDLVTVTINYGRP